MQPRMDLNFSGGGGGKQPSGVKHSINDDTVGLVLPTHQQIPLRNHHEAKIRTEMMEVLLVRGNFLRNDGVEGGTSYQLLTWLFMIVAEHMFLEVCCCWRN